jgi:hypothetical protein
VQPTYNTRTGLSQHTQVIMFKGDAVQEEILWEDIYDILLAEIYKDFDDGCVVGFGEATDKIMELLKDRYALQL